MTPSIPHAQAVGNINAGMGMLREALALLRSVDEHIDELVRVSSDRARNAIGEGATPFLYAVGPNGIVVPAGTQMGTQQNPILQANPRRRGSFFFNSSPTQIITLGLGIVSPSAGIGYVLAPNQFWNGMIGNMVWTGIVSAVSSAAGGLLTGVEA